MAGVRYVVQCKKHGVESKDWAGKMVVVPKANTKKQRNEQGCPFCRKEAQKEAEAAAQASTSGS